MRFASSSVRGAAIAAAVGAFCFVGSAQAAEMTGAGATFPYPVYAKWAEAYKAKTGVSLNYQSIGSGGGIKQIKAKTVDFGASDMPLKPADLAASGIVQWPMIMGGVVPVVNVPGIKAGQMKLSGKLLADIYLGKVKSWNAPEIAKLNPNLKLPNKPIAVVHRSDGSGTTFLFTSYLAAVNPEWKDKVGVSTAVEWPAGIGGKGNEGVANFARQTPDSIGYVEYAYALQNKLAYTQLSNKEGAFVTPKSETFQSAAANADWAHTPGYSLVLANQPGKNSWPITGASFILMHTSQTAPARAAEVLKFFNWAYANGAKMAEALDYVPMPANVAKMVEATWAEKIKSADGKPVWPAK